MLPPTFVRHRPSEAEGDSPIRAFVEASWARQGEVGNVQNVRAGATPQGRKPLQSHLSRLIPANPGKPA